jgi:CDP-diacylglycerol--serine O-phosphatidyltransferase
VIRHFLNPPNWFTSASIFCSVYALSLILTASVITPEVLVRASVLVVFGGVFDLLDGRVARITKRFSEFGVQLDSIADIIGFGLAPAMIVFSWKLHELGSIGVAATFWFVLCAAFRLARFNVDTVQHRWQLEGHTQGLTSTMAGGSLVSFVWVSNGYLAAHLDPSPVLVAVITATLGGMMISSIPFRNGKDLRQSAYARRLFAVCLSTCLAAAFVFDFSMYWGLGAILYLTCGLGDGIVTATRHRFVLGEALLLPAEDESGLFHDES